MRLYLITHIYLLWKIFRGDIRRKRKLCWRCKHWEECFKYIFGNNKQDYMKEIKRDKDSWGDTIIDVYSCERYKYEYPDTGDEVM